MKKVKAVIGAIIATGIIGEVIYKSTQLSGRSDEILRPILVIIFIATWLGIMWFILPYIREKQ